MSQPSRESGSSYLLKMPNLRAEIQITCFLTALLIFFDIIHICIMYICCFHLSFLLRICWKESKGRFYVQKLGSERDGDGGARKSVDGGSGGGGKKRRGRLMGHEFDSCESLNNSSIIQNLNLQLGLVINLSKNNKKFK